MQCSRPVSNSLAAVCFSSSRQSLPHQPCSGRRPPYRPASFWPCQSLAHLSVQQTSKPSPSHTSSALCWSRVLGLGSDIFRSTARCGVRCHCTPVSKPPGPLNHPIPWLCEVQAWPDTAAVAAVSTIDNSTAAHQPDGNGSSAESFGTLTPASSSNGSRTSHWPASAAEDQVIEVAADGLANMQFDAIMVLAGGLTADGGLPEWVHRRLDVARGLHFLHGRRPPIVCLGGGTPHKPAILGPNGHVIHESTSCANYLMDTGVRATDIFKEVSSYDTVGNAYFSLTIHALPAGWRRLAVVTSHFHMSRTRALFAGLYQLAGNSLFNEPHWYSLTFLSASDEGVFDDYVYNARLDKEAGSLQHWQSVASGLKHLSDFHAWLYADHLCYAVPRQHEFGKRTIKDPKLLESY